MPYGNWRRSPRAGLAAVHIHADPEERAVVRREYGDPVSKSTASRSSVIITAAPSRPGSIRAKRRPRTAAVLLKLHSSRYIGP